jgi:hypothetical protein
MELITIYAITAKSLDDGHRLNYGYYLSSACAELAKAEYPTEMNAQICTYEAVRLDDGRTFMVPRDCLKFNDDKQRILSKLTKQERAILGV